MFFCGLLLFWQEKKIAEYFADSKVWHNFALAFRERPLGDANGGRPDGGPATEPESF